MSGTTHRRHTNREQVEVVLWGVQNGDEDWQEVVLYTTPTPNPKRFDEVKVLAKRDGWGRFRISTIDLSTPPDFTKAVGR